jgi:hypothetical protein
MKLLQVTVLLALIASPVLAQNAIIPQRTVPSTQHSGAGMPGQPGSKGGPAVGLPGQTASADQTNTTTRLQDPSKIPGKPGGKSGPAVTPPSHSAEKP